MHLSKMIKLEFEKKKKKKKTPCIALYFTVFWNNCCLIISKKCVVTPIFFLDFNSPYCDLLFSGIVINQAKILLYY